MPSVDRSHYPCFLKNPQQVGAWCLRVHITETAQHSIQTLLNLDPWYFHQGARFRSRNAYESYGLDIPPKVLVRLFAYLRACLPKSIQSDLPDFAPTSESIKNRPRSDWSRGRYAVELRETATQPTRLSPKKRARLAPAVSLFQDYFAAFSCNIVPESPGKVDFRNRSTNCYFQASQEPQGLIKIFSIHEETIQKLRALLTVVIGNELKTEVIRVYSPEALLMELYVPILNMHGPSNLLSDVSTTKNLSQILDEVREARFVHAIRATGIAVEELLVEIFETYTHEKAPSSPLGELLSSLQARLKEIVHGQSKKNGPEFGDARKAVGKFIEQEKKSTQPSAAALSLAEVLQKTIVPLLDELGARAAESSRSTQKEIKVVLFPFYVQRCIGELVNLRNRVSHRVEKIASSVTNVGYIEASLGLRAYVVLASWWYAERGQIDYKQSRKKIVEETVGRSALQSDASGESPTVTIEQKGT